MAALPHSAFVRLDMELSNDLQEIIPLIPDGCVRKGVVAAGRVRDAHQRYLRAGRANYERQLFSAFGGKGMAQENQIEIAVPELNDRLSDRPRGYYVASSRLPEWLMTCQK